ncbi:MAG TPA: tRNA (adenosine(37)-N6)-dimethylallyltransferase MiaA [Candidatus Saccharibacteria bacterium]|nr:tRNA (adenosine(37)-N6)-dimethylallyltransferase MiaA [Candidatus Saccharibacteria bacterium]
MASVSDNQQPLLVIVGSTASGKTGLAIEVAKLFGGEVICADSRTIYKGMDVGTAKPTEEEQQAVPHWGLDLVEPSEDFSAADFKRYALDKVEEIRVRGNLPIITGGTGLYIDAILFDYQFGPRVDAGNRKRLEAMELDELYQYCADNNIKLPENYKNKRYVIRAIEKKNISTTRKNEPIDNTIVVGITTENEELRRRIEDRFEHMLKHDVVSEATMLGKKYGWDNQAMTGNIYPLIRLYLKKEITLSELRDKFTTLDWQLAKRQRTWLKRNPYVHWVSLTEALSTIRTLLAHEQ